MMSASAESTPRQAIGIDVGGTKIETIVLDSSGREYGRERIATPRGDYDSTLDAIAELVRNADQGRSLPIGVGAPGSVSPTTGLHRNANSTCLNGRSFRADLESKLGRTVAIANDADCLALSESIDGAAAGAALVFGVILGTGCGGGVVVNGAIVRGTNGIAGEWGHNPLPRVGSQDAELPARTCWCGRIDCIEAWISGSALTEGQDRVRLPSRLGRALAVVVNIIDPDVIVFGGGVSLTAGLVEQLACEIRPHVFADHFKTPLRRASHGDSSGVRGAARLAL